jgi:hypothetical protein
MEGYWQPGLYLDKVCWSPLHWREDCADLLKEAATCNALAPDRRICGCGQLLLLRMLTGVCRCILVCWCWLRRRVSFGSSATTFDGFWTWVLAT